MLKVAKDLACGLFGFLYGERSVGGTKRDTDGNALFALADLRAAVDVKQLDVLYQLAARAANRLKDTADLKCFIANEREVTNRCGVLGQGV